MRIALPRLPLLLRRLFARRPEPEAPLYFTELRQRSDAEWRAALAENPAKAARWVYAAAVWGDIDAQLYWAQMLLAGYGTARDPEAAFRWYGIAARSRRADAVNLLGRCHERGWGTPADPAKAAACYAAAQESDWAKFNLAALLLDGNGVARDPPRAFALFIRAAAGGHVKAMTMVGRCCEHGLGRPPDLGEAVRWYRRGAEGGDFRGQYHYGRLLFQSGAAEEALAFLDSAVEAAPPKFCGDVADELLRHEDPRLRAVGARAAARLGRATA